MWFILQYYMDYENSVIDTEYTCMNSVLSIISPVQICTESGNRAPLSSIIWIVKSPNMNKIPYTAWFEVPACETGRYTKPVTPRSQSFSNHCTQYALGDAMHFLLSCPKFVARRKLLFDDLEILGTRNAKDFKTFLLWWTMGMETRLKILVWWLCKFVLSCQSPNVTVVFPVVCATYVSTTILEYMVECS